MSSKARIGTALGIIVVVVALSATAWQLFARADVVIGGKDFTEQDLLCEMMALMIEDKTDLSVDARSRLGGTMVCFNALKGDDLDLYAEYTGTGLVNILDREAISDPDKCYEVVAEQFEEEYNLIWLEPFGFNNTFTLTMRREQAEELGIETYSDLAEHLRGDDEPQLVAGFTAEFLDRPDGYQGLIEHYDMEFAEDPKQLDPGIMYKACADKDVDVICGFLTDGRIQKYNLKVLEDDKSFFPAYYAAPVIRAEKLDEYPQLRDILNQLGGKLDTETMRRLNFAVDEEGRPPREVAREFLIDEGLISEE